MIAYPAEFKREADGITVTFPDIPEAITCGYSEAEAAEYAVDAAASALSEYIKRRQEIPRAGKIHGKDLRPVILPALAEAKIRLYEAMRREGVRKADLARRLKWQKSQVDRLLDLTHQSRLDQIEEALAALDKRLALQVRDARVLRTAAKSAVSRLTAATIQGFAGGIPRAGSFAAAPAPARKRLTAKKGRLRPARRGMRTPPITAP